MRYFLAGVTQKVTPKVTPAEQVTPAPTYKIFELTK